MSKQDKIPFVNAAYEYSGRNLTDEMDIAVTVGLIGVALWNMPNPYCKGIGLALMGWGLDEFYTAYKEEKKEQKKREEERQIAQRKRERKRLIAQRKEEERDCSQCSKKCRDCPHCRKRQGW